MTTMRQTNCTDNFLLSTWVPLQSMHTAYLNVKDKQARFDH